jgi:hypothetical protein
MAFNAVRERTNDGTTWIYPAIIFFVFLSAMMARSSASLILSDGDTFWHLTVGEHIFRTHSFPVVDEYSYTRAGAPWIAKEWLSQIILYLAYTWTGWRGLALFTATIAALSYSILFAWLCRRVEPIVALTMTAVTVSLGMGSLLARPQIFFYLLLTLCACGLVGAVEKKTTPWWLVPLAAIWANLHASFPIAVTLGALFGLEAVALAEPGERLRTAMKWALVLVAAVAATGATPYGFRPLVVSVNLVGSKEIGAINEWQPLRFDVLGVYGVAVFAGSLALLAAARAGWKRAAPLVLCGALMIRHVRFLPLFAIVAAPALARSIARLFPRFARQSSVPSVAMRKAATVALGVACLATVLILTFAPKSVPNPSMAPSAALDAAERLHLTGPVFNDYSFGGFLIFKGIKPFIDGRAELYFGEMFEKTREAELGVSSRPLMEHSCRVIRRMRYGTGSSRGRHDDSGGPSSDTA